MDPRAEAFIRSHTTPSRPPLVPEVSLYLATELTPLWQATADVVETHDPLPFWAFAWPGSQALGRHLLDHPELVRGRRVLDFAGGCGLAAIAAVKAGALAATSSDLDAFCETAVALNSDLNGVSVEATSEDLLARPAAELATHFDVVVAGDVFYEKPTADAALRWLWELADAGALVLVGDPGRIYSPRYEAGDTGLEVVARYEVPTSRELEDREVRTTLVVHVRPLDRVGQSR